MTGEKVAYTLTEFCKSYPCSRSEAYREIARGNLKAAKRGRHTIITAESARAWLDNLPALPSAA
jgi:hypothetical protein